MVVYGEKDGANRKASIELAAKLKNAEIQTIADVGHEVNIDTPDKLMAILQNFYDKAHA